MESSILFASQGASVLLVDINVVAADRVAAIIAQKVPGAKVLTAKADVGREDDVKAAVDKAVDEFGRLDIMASGIQLRGIVALRTAHVVQQRRHHAS